MKYFRMHHSPVNYIVIILLYLMNLTKVENYSHLKKKGIVGKGNYGELEEYNLSNTSKSQLQHRIRIAVKKIKLKPYESRNDRDVLRIYSKIYGKNNNMLCDIIPFRPIDNTTYFMLKVDSDLMKWINMVKTSNNAFEIIQFNFNKILSRITKQLLCLLQLSDTFVYTDLKPENIGVNFDKKTMKIKDVFLVDLESMLPNKDGYIFTYPCKQMNLINVYRASLLQKKYCFAYLLELLAFRLVQPIIKTKQYKTLKINKTLNGLKNKTIVDKCLDDISNFHFEDEKFGRIEFRTGIAIKSWNTIDIIRFVEHISKSSDESEIWYEYIDALKEDKITIDTFLTFVDYENALEYGFEEKHAKILSHNINKMMNNE